MIDSLSGVEPRLAVGVLAGASLELEQDAEVSVFSDESGEADLRRKVIEEVRSKLGLDPDDQSAEAIDKVTDALDAELDRLTGKPDVDQAFGRLSASGNLPADLFNLHIIPNVQELYQKDWLAMSDAILNTVKNADKEEHFGGDANKEIPALVSLFSKYFPHEKYPYQSFTLLVVAKREGLSLDVHQAWCIYPDTLPLAGTSSRSEDLLDLYMRFANVFGHEFELDGKRGKFEMNVEAAADVPLVHLVDLAPQTITDGRGRRVEKQVEVLWSHFQSHSADGKTVASLVAGFDLQKYRAMLAAHGRKL